MELAILDTIGGVGFDWNPYWLPELKNLPKAQRKRIWNTALKKAGNRWELILAGLLLGGLPLLVGTLINQYRLPSGIGFVLYLLAVGIVFAIHQHWMISFLRPRIYEQIPGLCPACGYDIRATPDRCPECGRICSQGDCSS